LSGFSASKSLIPVANSIQSSGGGASSFADTAYKGAVTAGKELGTQALAATLAPTATQPISGSFEGFSPTAGGNNYAPSGSDLFQAFGTNTPGLTDQLTQEDYTKALTGLGANTYLQQQSTTDTFLPTGQDAPDVNTPYGKQLTDINASANQGAQDLTQYYNDTNKNRYMAKQLMDANPGLITTDMINQWAANPDTAPAQLMDLFKGPNAMRPL
jgi:hypothetical protein